MHKNGEIYCKIIIIYKTILHYTSSYSFECMSLRMGNRERDSGFRICHIKKIEGTKKSEREIVGS